ncbi:MAG: hypothetical protein KDD52_06220 [Bdellovibrionales bacterium]|nr:hypothetical protein [Bdellovibrionales bacterium]
MKSFWMTLCLVGILSPAAWGQFGLSNLVSPGELSSPHKSLEGIKNCTQCHSTGSGVPDQKCLDCHKDIDEQLKTSQGYHARLIGDCATCHSEHKGKSYDLMGLKRMDFDHTDTGWPLTGAHDEVKCEACHKKKRESGSPSYLGLDTQCQSCHQDIHRGRSAQQKKCERCHSTGQWKPIRDRINFDHNQETRYRLTGSHRSVDCYACHTKKNWAPYLFEQCTDCHKDPHRGQFGTSCTKCHNTNSWGKSRKKVGGEAFDHSKTRFPLRGQHRSVPCVNCHGPVIGKMENFDQCSGCHNNPHGTQFQNLWTPKDCTSCHQEQSWTRLDFSHNKDARYELQGKHLEVPCQQCHYDRKYRWLSGTPDCGTCHEDVHRGQFSDRPCMSCHDFEGFAKKKFDHSKTRFPLVGKHQKVQCSSCHLQGRYAGIGTDCQNCHNDFHDGELGQACKRCHAPTAFNDIEFDHNRSSRFKIDGAHEKNLCNQCHWNNKYKLGKFDCGTCHRDVHQGSFGTGCARCHTTTEFERSEGYHDFGDFSLGGVHDQLECDQCHSPTKAVRVLEKQCGSCHRDPHMNSLSDRCIDCHRQTSWLPSTFQHNQTGFELSGAHRFLECSDCHYSRVFGGLPQECYFCHFKDFNPSLPAHAGGSTTCDSCHYTFGFRPTK